jgi:hypothetical protein
MMIYRAVNSHRSKLATQNAVFIIIIIIIIIIIL